MILIIFMDCHFRKVHEFSYFIFDRCSVILHSIFHDKAVLYINGHVKLMPKAVPKMTMHEKNRYKINQRTIS